MMRNGFGKAAVLLAAGALLMTGCESGGKRGVDDGADAPAEVTYRGAWQQLQVGMDPVEVIDLINAPRDVEVSRLRTTWYYGAGRGADAPKAVFDTRSMRLERWHAPE